MKNQSSISTKIINNRIRNHELYSKNHYESLHILSPTPKMFQKNIITLSHNPM